MKLFLVLILLTSAYVFSAWKWGGLKESISAKLEIQAQFEKKALVLAKKNRLLEKEISNLKYMISKLESERKYLSVQHQIKNQIKDQGPERSIASIPKIETNDLVNFDVYKWTPEKLLAIGEKEFHFKNYEKSAQFYHELIHRFPQHNLVSDRVLFGAGVAAFETGKRYDWSEKYLSRLVTEYPKSEFYRGAKLWLALSQYNQGDHKKFATTVEEFRVKYRNTDEWKILSRYYENITEKIKQ